MMGWKHINNLMTRNEDRDMPRKQREMNMQLLRPELDDFNREMVELHQYFDERCPCTSHKIHPDRIEMQRLSPQLMERNIRSSREAKAKHCLGDYVQELFGNFNLSSFEDCHGRIFALDIHSRTCFWSYFSAFGISESSIRKHAFHTREEAHSDRDEEKETFSTYQSEQENQDDVEELLHRARESSRSAEVFRDLICEFHGSYWIYECFYNPMGGKIRVPWQSNKRIWCGPFTDWCQARNMIRIPSLTYFNMVTREDCTWLLKSKNQRFSQCDICWDIHSNLHDQSTWNMKRLFGHIQCGHIEVVRNSRRWSNIMQLLAKWFPRMFHFQMSDRWNAMTTCVPWVWRCVSVIKISLNVNTADFRLSKSLEQMKTLRHSVSNVISEFGNFFFVSDERTQYKLASARIDSELKVFGMKIMEAVDGEDVGRNIIFVEDGARENINHFRFMTHAILIKSGIYKTVQIMLMEKGHSHWKCDACFGVLSQKLASEGNAMTKISHLYDFLVNGHCPHHPDGDEIESFTFKHEDIIDWNGWINKVCRTFSWKNLTSEMVETKVFFFVCGG